MDLNLSIENLKGVGEKTTEAFNRLGVFSCKDLINYYPRAYDKYEMLSNIAECETGKRCAVAATVKSNPKVLRFNGKSIVSFFISDGNLNCEVRFFNSPFMSKAFKLGDKKVFRGFLKVYKDKLVIDQPKVYGVDEYSALENKIMPIYSLTKDITNSKIQKSVETVLSKYELPNDYLLDDECNMMHMNKYNEALVNIHFPKDEEVLYLSRRRLIFDEFINFIAIGKNEKSDTYKKESNYKMLMVSECNRLMESLPYELTNAQKKAVQEVFEDLSGEYLMNRLIQGDVGSGKTIIAILALLMTAANGFQGAMMAPTEVLARQHFDTIKNMGSKYSLCIKPALITGKMSAKEKREVLKQIEDGDVNVIVGTHALIQDNVFFKNLALVITDEQHRFGVKQRETFKNKSFLEPHLLVMSATPIPRTLAMIMFADLSVSIIDELPKNRIPISNCVVNSSYRDKAYAKIKSEINKGHQAYVICPMVFESEEDALGLKSVEQHSKDIKEYFGETVRVGSLSGKMKPEEKTRIMESFKDHNIDILVSTTVVEVGVDVPNATVILIENAERFGLSQLHQLRGRVGRGSFESFCILLSDTSNKETLKRLEVLNKTNDGFVIASEDMKMRGPGELNGIRQSGELQFGLGDIVSDGDILLLASEKYESLKDRISFNPSNFIDFRTI